MYLVKLSKEKVHAELEGKIIQLTETSFDEYGVTVLRFTLRDHEAIRTVEIRQGKYSANVDVYIEQKEEVKS